MEKPTKVRQEEGCFTGPGFGHKNKSVALMREYAEMLRSFFMTIQQEDSDLIKATYDVQLFSFDPVKKIVLIKEVRAILNLGLKEVTFKTKIFRPKIWLKRHLFLLSKI